MEDQNTHTTPDASPAGDIGTTVTNGIISSLRGLNDIETEMVNLGRNTVSQTLQATGGVTTESLAVINDVVKATLQAADEVGTGLIVSTRSVAKGVILGVSDVGGDVITVAYNVAKSTVFGAAEIGGDVATIASGAVWGIIEATRETGGDVAKVATAGADGALEAAGTLGNTAVRAVARKLLIALWHFLESGVISEGAHLKEPERFCGAELPLRFGAGGGGPLNFRAVQRSRRREGAASYRPSSSRRKTQRASGDGRASRHG